MKICWGGYIEICDINAFDILYSLNYNVFVLLVISRFVYINYLTIITISNYFCNYNLATVLFISV